MDGLKTNFQPLASGTSESLPPLCQTPYLPSPGAFGGRQIVKIPESPASFHQNLGLEKPSTRSIVSYAVQKVKSLANWIVENRGGLTKIASGMLISAQYKFLSRLIGNSEPHFAGESRTIIDSACNASHQDGYKSEAVTLSHGDRNIGGVICHPHDQSSGDQPSRIVVFNNMNGKTISNFFRNDRLATTPEGLEDGNPVETPGNVQQALGCPVLLYDYTGTGCNRENGILRYAPTATPKTAVADAKAALHSALQLGYDEVVLVGSSMGGGLSTVALEEYLSELSAKEAEQVGKRIKLVKTLTAQHHG